MAADRISKFFDDAKALLSKDREISESKINSEIKRMRTWLQKHQNEVVPDGSKTKLFGVIDLFYRFSCVIDKNSSLFEGISDLLSDYLQIPEGKLLSSKDKKKVLNWVETMKVSDSDQGKAAKNRKLSCWYVEEILKGSLLTLLSVENEELWLENFEVKDKNIYDEIKNMMDIGNPVIVEIQEGTNCVVSIKNSNL